MQVGLHSSAQRTGNGNGDDIIEPGFQARALIINVSQISVNLLGSISFKVQHSFDGSDWSDIPNLATAGLTGVGITTVAISPVFSCLNHIRVVWTFGNANSVTFVAVVTGDK